MTSSATILDGKAIARTIRADLKQQVFALAAAGLQPRLDVIMVGAEGASLVYTRNKERACKRAGIMSQVWHLPADAPSDEVEQIIRTCNADEKVHGIMLQLPLPASLDERHLSDVIDPRKDVDCLTSHNLGLLMAGQPGPRPCTPLAVMALLDHAGIQLSGAKAAVVGRSTIVGKPVAQLLLERNATVTICHSRTADLGAILRDSDIVIAAVGHTALITPQMISPGTVVIDVGTNPQTDGSLRGDVDFDSVAKIAAAISPVPGGVGPLTVTMLLHNVITAAKRQIETA